MTRWTPSSARRAPNGDTTRPEGWLRAAKRWGPQSRSRVEAHRYAEQPWMHETFGYERWAGRDVLEVGVGLGTDHLQFARAGACMTGIDLTPLCVESRAAGVCLANYL
jgi:2-polyprenyl-3-methyl-5-hydroxy-6-metoxy-1,4-benzoquinol methylase